MRTEEAITTAKRTVQVGENRPFEQFKWDANRAWWS